MMKHFPTLALLLVFGLPLAALPAGATPARGRSVAAWQQPSQQAPGSASQAPQSQQQAGQQQQQQQASPQQQQQQQAQTFTGTMIQKSGKYLFVDDASKATRKLDHQQALSKYQLNGKKVEILGTLDAANNTIHIIKIAVLRSKA
jgi:uncharacterized protein YdeI (BOF family)